MGLGAQLLAAPAASSHASRRSTSRHHDLDVAAAQGSAPMVVRGIIAKNRNFSRGGTAESERPAGHMAISPLCSDSAPDPPEDSGLRGVAPATRADHRLTVSRRSRGGYPPTLCGPGPGG